MICQVEPRPRISGPIEIQQITAATLSLVVVGTSPYICNRMSEKAKRELFFPAGKKTAADKASNLKHDPVEEFRASPYTLLDPETPTLLALMAASFKRAMMTAALDAPGATKTQIGRLAHVEGHLLPLYGKPQLFSVITRGADIKRTPDVRTRAVIPAWACRLTVSFTFPLLNETTVVNLLALAGQTSGVGDWRPEKGSGSFGQFRATGDDNDPEFCNIVANGGRSAQEAAMEAAAPYDEETAALLDWFDVELKRRGRQPKSG